MVATPGGSRGYGGTPASVKNVKAGTGGLAGHDGVSGMSRQRRAAIAAAPAVAPPRRLRALSDPHAHRSRLIRKISA